MTSEILIVDDNVDIRNILNELIIDEGYKTRLAANYNQALAEIDKKLPEVLTETEITKLIESYDLNDNFGQRNRTIIEVLYGTGIRVSELINLKLSNIFFEENIMKITGKGNKERFVPLGKIATIEIKKYLNDRDKLKINLLEEKYKDE